MVLHTNKFAKAENPKSPWRDICSAEIYVYIGVLCYDGVVQLSDWREYWNQDSQKGGFHPAISKAITLNRFQCIQRYLCINDPDIRLKDPSLPFEQVAPLSDHLLRIFKEVWNPGANIAVDETVYRFEGRARWTVNIPSKPYPIGAKIWITADRRFVLHWIWHVKGDGTNDGPQFKNPKSIPKGFSKTTGVVFESLSSLPNNGKGLTVWLDNLFTETTLCRALRNDGIGCAGTVRTSKTPREYMEEDGLSPEAAKQAALSNKAPDIKVSYTSNIIHDN
jgi:hypothetical protein